MPWYKDKIFWAIFAVAALVKLATLLYVMQSPLGEQLLVFPDSLGYVYPAQTLLSYGQFWEAVSASPMLLRTPGYPVFLALVQFVSGSLTWAVAITQNLLSLLLLVPVYLTTLRLADKNAARWTAGFCAASVLYFSLSFSVLSETLCVFLLAWFVYAALRWLENRQGIFLFLAAALLSAAIYVRPVAYYFAGLSALLLGGLAYREKSRRVLKQSVLFFIGPVILFVGAWQVRNYITAGYGGFTTVAAYNMYIWNEDFVAKEKGIDVAQAHDELLARLPGNFTELSAKKQVKTYKQLAAPLLKQSWKYKLFRVPLWAAKTLLGTNHVHTTRLILARADEPESTLNQTGALPRRWLNSLPDKLIFAVSLLQVMATALLGFIGLGVLFKNRPTAALFLAVYVCYFWGLGSSFLGAYARFRAPFEFVLCITAGIAVSACCKRYRHRCPKDTN